MATGELSGKWYALSHFHYFYHFILSWVDGDDFDFDIGNFPFLDGDVPRSTSYGVYCSGVQSC